MLAIYSQTCLPCWVWSCRSQQRQPGMLGWGKMLSAVCEQWEGLILPALSATNLVVTPWLHLSVGKVCCCHFLLAFAWFPQRWPSARLLCSSSSHQIAERIYFPSPLAPAHLRKKKKLRWRQIFSIRGGSRWMCWLQAAALLLLPPLRSSCSLACTASGKREVVSNF